MPTHPHCFDRTRFRVTASARETQLQTRTMDYANRICCLSFRAHSYILLCFASWPPLNGSPTDRFEWTPFLVLFTLWGILAKNRAHSASIFSQPISGKRRRRLLAVSSNKILYVWINYKNNLVQVEFKKKPKCIADFLTRIKYKSFLLVQYPMGQDFFS